MAEYFFNNIVLVGRVGGDAEIKYFDSGKAKATTSLAVNRKTGKANDLTDWFRIEFWNKDAEIASEYIKKGMLLSVEGRININKWTDANGVEQEMHCITANSFRMLSSKKDMAEMNAQIQ